MRQGGKAIAGDAGCIAEKMQVIETKEPAYHLAMQAASPRARPAGANQTDWPLLTG